MKPFASILDTLPQRHFDGIQRNYTPEDVVKLRGSIHTGYTLAGMGANWL